MLLRTTCRRVLLAAVHGVLDFIYYAQYQSHTEATLCKMDDTLKLFHQNKAVFVDLGIQNDFNIPKIHSMVHYTASIWLFGSADGFNTELPKQLHIDLAKHPYRASNKRNYVIQMTKWLRRQDSLYLQDLFLTITLKVFLHATFPMSRQPVRICSFDRINVFKYITILAPSHQHISDAKHLFKIHARKKPSPAIFNTALIIEDPEQFTGTGVAGMRVGQIKVIFKLPPSSNLGKTRHPLAYIHWFRPLQSFDDQMKMFRLTRSS
ncbi:hypothetical protein PAXRUDRAFT_36706 [Paxillus rubicundulus Ve08.2h10]|uniref:Uncharacterized protein n=1 Tax=Paxillus rubicundulus Ve08.2h10 TaxID=930991 RepID=A0A0D0DIV3_9AGAM|nr:hypothetical protein PAXRUDRAFT_36706 [Paxillus rubicundulus Ve08.2h10]